MLALCAIIFLCLRVADLKSLGNEPTWKLYATFDNIGGLKAGSPVKVGGGDRSCGGYQSRSEKLLTQSHHGY